ncbi:Protein ZINC INDUCED FACILITATOR-LIKE 1 [Geodia barretti]|uniref:Protein ZINC INDUCED FACILITATOR-LIKE 1 n=1 Tax=Geodia barretti TaxID=519541 RepID=A0AA35QU70_GEOBA|nr:Protein ZINC INDUCED FACILITATOR-LIKE 1 [Geodia barretti]
MPHSGWFRRRLFRLIACSRAKAKGIKITRRDLKIFIPAFLALFSSAYSITMLFPFLPFMVQFLLPQVEEENIGKYAGFIASSMFLGRFFGSYAWGALADKKGRKPVVIVSCVLIGLSSAAFGFSVQIYMAVVFRFFVGLFNGVAGTVKAIISESTTNRSQALGMSLIICAFSLGLIMGPAVSGALADPIGQYNLNISSE